MIASSALEGGEAAPAEAGEADARRVARKGRTRPRGVRRVGGAGNGPRDSSVPLGAEPPGGPPVGRRAWGPPRRARSPPARPPPRRARSPPLAKRRFVVAQEYDHVARGRGQLAEGRPLQGDDGDGLGGARSPGRARPFVPRLRRRSLRALLVARHPKRAPGP
ncbi:unnamed protein product [Arctia plantaginis]|uniref:Uncharacterized protein n=1 Tax=Arctia plantaginis TaxID=874455 RepID=A0A8S1B5T1_ARCPL|nr:unnamed protein product [Arctia plantaginis]